MSLSKIKTHKQNGALVNMCKQISLLNSLMTKILLDPKEARTLNLLLFIRIMLNKFNLESDFDETEILIEAYRRAIDRLRSDPDYVMKNPCNWLKGTALNIIREISYCKEKDRRLRKKNNKDYKQQEQNNLICSEDKDIDPRVENVIQAFQHLKAQDREILNLRIVQGLSWSDIGARLVSEGQEPENNQKLNARLRQRCRRALKRLRDNYYSFE